MSRKSAREDLFKLIYEFCIVGEKNSLTYNLLIKDMPEGDLDYLKKMYCGIIDSYDKLSAIIEDFAHSFSLGRIYKVDLAIMLIATYEILYVDDISYAVSVNEALELSKVYSTEKSGPFINGILSSVIKERDNLR